MRIIEKDGEHSEVYVYGYHDHHFWEKLKMVPMFTFAWFSGLYNSIGMTFTKIGWGMVAAKQEGDILNHGLIGTLVGIGAAIIFFSVSTPSSPDS